MLQSKYLPTLKPFLLYCRNHPLFTVDSSIRQLVSQDVIVTKDLSDIATYILQELDAPVVEMSDITNASAKRVRKMTTQTTTTTTSKSKSKKQQQHQQPVVAVPADPSYVPSDDDYSSNLDMDMSEQQNDEVSMDNVTTTIRQLCEEISDATYRATDLDACAKLSQTLSEALATFNASIHNHIQEEIVYGQFYWTVQWYFVWKVKVIYWPLDHLHCSFSLDNRTFS